MIREQKKNTNSVLVHDSQFHSPRDDNSVTSSPNKKAFLSYFGLNNTITQSEPLPAQTVTILGGQISCSSNSQHVVNLDTVCDGLATSDVLDVQDGLVEAHAAGDCLAVVHNEAYDNEFFLVLKWA